MIGHAHVRDCRFMADQEAWSELAEMYTELEMYSQAAFCVEELIAAAPHNYLNHLRYAEVIPCSIYTHTTQIE